MVDFGVYMFVIGLVLGLLFGYAAGLEDTRYL